MFSESEKKFIEQHRDLIESKSYNRLLNKSGDINFITRLILAMLYLSSPLNFIIRVTFSITMSYRVTLTHPECPSANFMFIRITNQDIYESTSKELRDIVENKLIKSLVNSKVPSKLAEDLVRNKCDYEIAK